MNSDESKGRHTAVVGASGFIGGAICTHVREQGMALAPITRRSHGDFQRASPSWFEGTDVMIHAGGVVPAHIRPGKEFQSGIAAAQAIFSAAQEADVQQMILVSSASVYGTSRTDALGEKRGLSPESPYGRACAAIESITRSIVHEAELTVVRPFNVYGRGGYGLVDRLMVAAKATSPLVLYGPDSIRDYIHADQVAQSVLRLFGHPGIVNLGTGVGRSSHEVVSMAKHAHPVLEDLVSWSDTAAGPDVSISDTRLARSLGLPIEDRLPRYLRGESG